MSKTRKAGWPSTDFCRYQENDKTKMRNYISSGSKNDASQDLCKLIPGFDGNNLYLYCNGGKILHSKEKYIEK